MTRALTPEQVDGLLDHLGEMLLEPEDLEAAVAAIDFAASFCGPRQSSASWKRSRGVVREIRTIDHDHFCAIAKHAAALLELLRKELPYGLEARPLWNMAGIAWDRFDAELAAVAASAKSEAEDSAPQKRPGRPPDGMRDSLISTIYSVYPPGTAKKSAGSHFERTVEMMLGFIGREVEDVHGLIVDALHRRPEPLFRVTPKR